MRRQGMKSVCAAIWLLLLAIPALGADYDPMNEIERIISEVLPDVTNITAAKLKDAEGNDILTEGIDAVDEGPDSAHLVCWAEKAGKWYITVDGVSMGEAYDEVAPWSPWIGFDDAGLGVAVAARNGELLRVEFEIKD